MEEGLGSISEAPDWRTDVNFYFGKSNNFCPQIMTMPVSVSAMLDSGWTST